MTSVRPSTIPFPESIIITPAEDNDLTVFKQAWSDNIFTKVILGDRIYSDKDYLNDYKKRLRILRCLLPLKKLKGRLKKLNKEIKLLMTYSHVLFLKSDNQ